MVIAVVAAIVALAALVGLAYDGANACACGSADDGAFEPAAEERPENSSASRADEGSFAWPDAALIVITVTIVMAIVVAGIVVLTALTALPNAVVELGISIVLGIVVVTIVSSALGICRNNRSKEKRDDE